MTITEDKQLVQWLHDTLGNTLGGNVHEIQELEDCCTGAVYCHLLSDMTGQPKTFIKYNASTPNDFIANFKLLQQWIQQYHSTKDAIPPPLSVLRLIQSTKSSRDDHRQLVRWFANHYQQRQSPLPNDYADDVLEEYSDLLHEMKTEREFYLTKLMEIEKLCRQQKRQQTPLGASILECLNREARQPRPQRPIL